MIYAIWAQDEKGLIGKNDTLPWHLPEDLKFFKRMTEGNTIVMGRKTFEGMGGRLLPNRQTIILTSDSSYQVEGAIVMHSVDEVLNYSETYEGTLFITGGATIYKEFMPYVNALYRTLIHAEFEGDTYFPEFNLDDWTMVSISEGEKNEKNPYEFQFETYQRKNKKA